MTDGNPSWIDGMFESRWFGLQSEVIRAAAEAMGEERFKDAVAPVLDLGNGFDSKTVARRAKDVLDGGDWTMRCFYGDDMDDSHRPRDGIELRMNVCRRMAEDVPTNMRMWMHHFFAKDLRLLIDAGRGDVAERALGDIAAIMRLEKTEMWMRAPDEVRRYSEWIEANKGCGDPDRALDWSDERTRAVATREMPPHGIIWRS